MQDGLDVFVCDELGNLDGATSSSGFFASDTRFLSRLVLTVNDRRPERESLEQPAPLPRFVLLAAGKLSIIRERFVGNLMEEPISVCNRAEREVEVALAVEACRSGKVAGVVVAKHDRRRARCSTSPR